MGICTSAHATAEQAKSHQIDAALDGSHEKEKARVKLLLLGMRDDGMGARLCLRRDPAVPCLVGAGESGKSTIFKQMRILYGKGFDEAARVGFKATIFSNILQSMRVLLQQADDLGFTVEAAEAKTAVTELADDAPVDCKDIATLWADPGIKQTYDSRSSFQLNDSAA